ncbi:hypothetical protein NLJ89_g8854 [Agrocybe chaxingu]|uniref:MFS general substrate transporter n=1 Tax=Agrocybe chaxingu TaxID=84603 RepID=A0A9W8JUF2_9AGAR|nr:hypothetical protein NLJ89_g8854 [Agrocybe chaxingu]
MSGGDSHAHPRAPRNTTGGSYDPESLILPDGPINEEESEILHGFAHPHHHEAEEALVESNEDESDDELAQKSRLPWWKRPSPWWLLAALPFTSIAWSMTIAPRIEIYTILACSVHKPDIFRQSFPGLELGLQSTSSHLCPEVYSPSQSYMLTTPLNERLAPIYIPDFSSLPDTLEKGNSSSPGNHRNLCMSDPVVQAAVAKLTAVIAAVMGILSCITTGWWGAFSDRHGRPLVMGISVLGLLFTDFIFIFVALNSKHVPGGYWFLVVGPLVEGSLGGMATGVAACHAYLADTSSENSRSRIFSFSLGLMFTGFAVGPALGSLLIRFTGHTLSVFFAAAASHVLYTILVFLILPESVSQKHMTLAKARYAAELLDHAQERERNAAVGVLVNIRRLFAFLSPLTVFLPGEDKARSNGNPLKKPKKDWNLTLMALGYGFTISIMGSYSTKFQYAASTFGWTAETLGYWLSLVGATRAFFLTVILPGNSFVPFFQGVGNLTRFEVAIKLFKPEPLVIELPAAPEESSPLLSSSPSEPSSSTTTPRPTIKKEIHSPSFDLALARISLLVEIISYTLMALSPSALAFTVFGIFGSLGTGFSPAVQSVTLALYARRGGTESGRLFGAMSVVQALCSQILGPPMYSFVYMKTVATYPRTIFFVTVFTLCISFFLYAFVRLPSEKEYHRGGVADAEEHSSTSHSPGTSGSVEATGIERDTTLVGEEARRFKRNVSSYGST